jgi:hypothetical protein
MLDSRIFNIDIVHIIDKLENPARLLGMPLHHGLTVLLDMYIDLPDV